jgi:hypothetical protein
MKHRVFKLSGMLGTLLVSVGCHSVLPTSQTTILSRWNSYQDVVSAFDKITPNQTSEADLKQLGFHPDVSPNVKILTYVDIIQTFMPNPAIRMQDLPPAVRECIEAKEQSQAFLVQLQNTQDKRHGSVFLDVFGFKRRTHESGWRFKGLILMKDNVVVYKLYSGEPQIFSETKDVKPLGPLQELNGINAIGLVPNL